MCLMWFDRLTVKPNHVIKGGMGSFVKGVLAGCRDGEFRVRLKYRRAVRIKARTDFRAGFGVFHSSNGFMVPSSPELDAMNWNAGLSCHFGHGRAY